MRKKLRDIKTGETLILSSGSYSDYSITGAFLVLKDFNPDDESKYGIFDISKDGKTEWFSHEKYVNQ